MKEAPSSSETSSLTRATRRNIPEDPFFEVGSACTTNGGKNNAYRLFVGKSERIKPLGRPRRGWVDNTRFTWRYRLGRYGLDWFASG
jgi:hypothetical protein